MLVKNVMAIVLTVGAAFERFQDVIRAREVDLQGSTNPMLSDFGDQSEARRLAWPISSAFG